MARYTARLTASIKYWYEETDRSVEAIAAEFDVSARNIQRLAVSENWIKRKDRKRRPRVVPIAAQLLEEAEGLAAQAPKAAATEKPGPHLRADDSGECRDGPEQQSASTVDLLEARVRQEIEALDEDRGARRGFRVADAERCARTLTTVTQTLHEVQRLRSAHAPTAEQMPDGYGPQDMDAFRDDLARRIDLFIASRTEREETGQETG